MCSTFLRNINFFSKKSDFFSFFFVIVFFYFLPANWFNWTVLKMKQAFHSVELFFTFHHHCEPDCAISCRGSFAQKTFSFRESISRTTTARGRSLRVSHLLITANRHKLVIKTNLRKSESGNFALCNINLKANCQLWAKCQAHLTVFDKRSEFIVVLVDPQEGWRLCWLGENCCSQIPFGC